MNPGDIALVNYGERPTTWHMRVLLAPTVGDSWVTLTPDLDIYEEEMSSNNVELVGFHNCGPGGNLRRINLRNVYAFMPMTPQELRGYMNQGQIEAARILGAAGAPGIGAVQPAPAPAPAAAPPPGAGPCVPAAGPSLDTWIAAEDNTLYKRGDVIATDPAPLPLGHVCLGDRDVIPDGAGVIFARKVAAADAARHRPVKFDAQGVRRREFHEAVALMDDDPPMGGGLQLSGPSSALKLLKDMRDQQFTPSTFHEHWLRSSTIPRGDRSVYEHELLSRIMDSMGRVDQLNVPALQSAELIRQAHRASPGNPDYSSADYFMGWKYKKVAGVDSELSAYVANERS